MKAWVAIARLDIDIPKSTLRYWCARGMVRAKKLGKRWFVHLPSMLQQNGFEELAEEILSANSAKKPDGQEGERCDRRFRS